MNQIAIVGVGLIGGSFALAARRAGLARRITGWNGTGSLDLALSHGIIDDVERTFEAGARCEADLIYLATPVCSIVQFLRLHGRKLKPGAVVTDAGSTKRFICAAAREALSEDVGFAGGHPMAGSHHSGVEHADANLFRGSPYIVVPLSHRRAVDVVTDAARAVGAEPIQLDPETHDKLVARISHLPQVMSIALALLAGSYAENRQLTSLAGSGFADMTRLAMSKWSIWEDICRTNGDEMAKALSEMTDKLEGLRSALEAKDFEALASAFGSANEYAAEFRTAKRTLE